MKDHKKELKPSNSHSFLQYSENDRERNQKPIALSPPPNKTMNLPAHNLVS